MTPHSPDGHPARIVHEPARDTAGNIVGSRSYYDPVTPVPVTIDPPTVPARAWQLDALRGFAVLAMIVDHVALFLGAEPLRYTVGRLAMPLFFVLGGALLTRPRWRHVHIAALGLLLPAVVPWVDDPNVLWWFGLGALLLTSLRRLHPGAVWLLLVVVVAWSANDYDRSVGTSYEPTMLVALMALGMLLRAHRGLDALTRLGARLPRWLAWFGRYPLTIYVGHAVLLTVVMGGGLGGR